MQKRVHHLNLGINLGWLSQATASGSGRFVTEVTADLERIRGAAAEIGYSGHDALVTRAVTELQRTQVLSRVSDEVAEMIGLFKGLSSGTDEAALTLGIICGRLQQGARGNDMASDVATGELETARSLAAQAGYQNHHVYINNALGRLQSGQRIPAIMGDVTALIGLLQGQL